jgi:hypothetical protein
MLSEWGSVEQGGDKGAWIQDAGRTIPAMFPRTRAVVWFDRAEFALETSPGSLNAARSAFGAAPYCLTYPY